MKNKELKKLRELLDLAIIRNDTKNILRIRKELLKLDSKYDEQIEEANLFD